ncbi:MAG: hypothetical protein COS84_08775 [Armatimonadetes bacterium CG07_land_8_20_14_0_80_40_9]|nr:MAG: hypothetical protein COS84_08775 [Armatimonadetes bacterium CG07_land_8_20_14_0_80_40_9]
MILSHPGSITFEKVRLLKIEILKEFMLKSEKMGIGSFFIVVVRGHEIALEVASPSAKPLASHLPALGEMV